jgi:hypothetical protein
MKVIVPFSGGKDSTATVLRMHELGERVDELLFTPTGDEPEDCIEHINKIVAMVGKPLVTPENKPLSFWIDFFNALPNWRQRWCTRLIKIEPCIRYLEANPGSTLCVGLRADEEERGGLYGPYATYRYPLREWGWGIKEVYGYLASRSIVVPKRTDCKRCYGQRIGEWWRMWKYSPADYASAEADEKKTGFTFRSAGRDTWPAPLSELRAQFESGRLPRGMKLNVIDTEEDDTPRACRVCSL